MKRIAMVLLVCTPLSLTAGEPKSAIPAIMRILKSGRLKGAQLSTVVGLVARRGNADDLAYIYAKAVEKPQAKNAWPAKLRLQVLQALTKAATRRKVVPPGGHGKLSSLIASRKPPTTPLQAAAIELAGAWKSKELAPAIQKVIAARSSLPLRKIALNSLAKIDSRQARALIEQLDTPGRPVADRFFAIAMLAGIDAQAAAKRAADRLAEQRGTTDLAALMDAFLNRKGGSDLLADALVKVQLREDTAKLALRHMFSIGRSDAKLNQVLDKHAGIQAQDKPLSKAEVKKIAAAVLAKGDPRRGEVVFRRKDLSCMKCHAVSKAGGNVGPDLSAVGSSTPVDYLINSILFPSQAIKEQYHSTVVVTVDGDIFTGIIVDKAGDQLVLRDANGKEVSIPKDDIEEQQKGRSLMPKGLAKFLTRQELLDLVRFLSQLGKPGPFAVRTRKTVQRWRVLRDVPAELVSGVPDVATLKTLVLSRTEAAWQPAYGMVAGPLPLHELAKMAKSGVLVLRAAVQATAGGTAQVKIDSAAGVTAWLGEKRIKLSQTGMPIQLADGLNQLTIRVDQRQRKSKTLRVEFIRPANSTAQFIVVGGR